MTEEKQPSEKTSPWRDRQGRGMFPACVILSVVPALVAWASFLAIALWAPSRGYVHIINLWEPVGGWPVLFSFNFLFAFAVSWSKKEFGELWLFGSPEDNGEVLRLFANGALVVLAMAAVIYSSVVLVTLVRKPVREGEVAKLPGIYRTDPDASSRE